MSTIPSRREFLEIKETKNAAVAKRQRTIANKHIKNIAANIRNGIFATKPINVSKSVIDMILSAYEKVGYTVTITEYDRPNRDGKSYRLKFDMDTRQTN
jgi:hypothetical protein